MSKQIKGGKWFWEKDENLNKVEAQPIVTTTEPPKITTTEPPKKTWSDMFFGKKQGGKRKTKRSKRSKKSKTRKSRK